MQAKAVMYVAVTFVVAVAAASVVTAEELVVCPLVDDEGVNATLLPNLYNCSTFYLCSQMTRGMIVIKNQLIAEVPRQFYKVKEGNAEFCALTTLALHSIQSAGVPELIECPRALQFNRKLNVCDYPWRAACVEIPLPEPELPTTQAPVATERVIITKTVKEVYMPVDEVA